MIIDGIPSGDLECWCLLVDKKTFKAVTGEFPDEEFDVGHFAAGDSSYRYKLYPSHLVGFENKGKLLRITFEVKELEIQK